MIDVLGIRGGEKREPCCARRTGNGRSGAKASRAAKADGNKPGGKKDPGAECSCSEQLQKEQQGLARRAGEAAVGRRDSLGSLLPVPEQWQEHAGFETDADAEWCIITDKCHAALFDPFNAGAEATPQRAAQREEEPPAESSLLPLPPTHNSPRLLSGAQQ